MNDLLYALSERPDGAYVPILSTPGGGDGSDCWWTQDLRNAKPRKVKVRLDDKRVEVLNVIDSDEGLFLSHTEWSNASRPD